MGKLDNKVAIVTGGSRGLGEATVRLFAREGAKVLLTDVLDVEGEALAAALGANVRFMHHDVSKEAEWQSVVAAAESAFGLVSVLVNNAGIAQSGPMETLSESEYSRVIAINQTGVFLGMKSVLASMRRTGGGSIINVSSIYGLRGSPQTIAYTASKFAVAGMTKAAAMELAPDRIRVNSIHPGFFATPMALGNQAVVDTVLPLVPAGRLGDPDEIAQMALLLASDDMKYATGAEFVVDGGFTTY